LLEPSGVAERLIAAGNPVTCAEIRRGGRHVADLELTILGNPHPYILVLPQGRTERLLEERLAGYGITVERKTECTGLSLSAATPTATLESAGGRHAATVDHVLGADGVHSTVRREAGIALAGGQSEPQAFGLVDATLSKPIDPTRVVFTMLPDGALGRIPISDRLVRYVSNRPDIGTAIPDSEGIEDIVWRSSFHITYGRAEKFQKGPVYLMGDAAHVHSPAGGRGMNLGMEDAAWFAWALSENRLDRYSDDRIPYAVRTLRFSRTQTGQITGATKLRNALAATIAPLMLAIPPIRRLAVRNILALDTPLPPWLD
jgi:2-polyprenyl-6-methoxyphenol hydroxylase-like FAD-dependent oxidoreductase